MTPFAIGLCRRPSAIGIRVGADIHAADRSTPIRRDDTRDRVSGDAWRCWAAWRYGTTWRCGAGRSGIRPAAAFNHRNETRDHGHRQEPYLKSLHKSQLRTAWRLADAATVPWE